MELLIIGGLATILILALGAGAQPTTAPSGGGLPAYTPPPARPPVSDACMTAINTLPDVATAPGLPSLRQLVMQSLLTSTNVAALDALALSLVTPPLNYPDASMCVKGRADGLRAAGVSVAPTIPTIPTVPMTPVINPGIFTTPDPLTVLFNALPDAIAVPARTIYDGGNADALRTWSNVISQQVADGTCLDRVSCITLANLFIQKATALDATPPIVPLFPTEPTTPTVTRVPSPLLNPVV